MEILDFFNEGRREIEEYLNLMEGIDSVVQVGVPYITGHSEKTRIEIEPRHRAMLHAVVPIQLYNLTESVVKKCTAALEGCLKSLSREETKCLTEKMKVVWIKTLWKTKEKLGDQKRYQRMVEVLEYVREFSGPHPDIEITSSGGNWTSTEICNFFDMFGINVRCTGKLGRKVNQPVRNGERISEYIKNSRNDLAHGNVTFATYGRDLTVSDLRRMADVTFDYLEFVIGRFEDFLRKRHYLDIP